MKLSGQHLFVMAIPIALKALFGIIAQFQSQELGELRITGKQLLASGVAVIREIVAAVVPNREINESAESICGSVQTFR